MLLKLLKHSLFILFVASIIPTNLYCQESTNIPISGDWENAGILIENDDVSVEIDYKLSSSACSDSDFGNSNHLYRFRITSKKPFVGNENKYVSFKIIFQDCQGTLICKTANLNIGIKKKNEVWDGIQPVSDPNFDNSFRGKKLISAFSEVKVNKEKDASKDGECFKKVVSIPERKPQNTKKSPPQVPEEKQEEPSVLLLTKSDYFPEIKIVKDAKFRLEPDIFSSTVGTISAAKKVLLIGKKEAFWKIQFKEREGYILISDNNINQKDAEDLLKNATELEKKDKAEIAPLPIENPKILSTTKAEEFAPNETTLLQNVQVKTKIDQTKKSTYIPKGEKIAIISYEEKHWVIEYHGKTSYLLDDNLYFTLNATLANIKGASFKKSKSSVSNEDKPLEINEVKLEREAKLRISPEYASEFKLIPAQTSIIIEGFYKNYWKIKFNSETGFLAEDMMYFHENPSILAMKANPLKEVIAKPAQKILDSEFPIYPGGESELIKDITAKMKYSIKPKAGKTIQITYELSINESGKVESIFIANSLSSLIDEEMSNAVKLIKTFSPATLNGKSIKSKTNVTLEFK